MKQLQILVRSAIIVIGIAIGGIAACSHDDSSSNRPGDDVVDMVSDSPDDGSDVQGPLILDVVVIENPGNVLSYFVQWRTSRPADTHLDIDCADLFSQTYESSALTDQHEVFVSGLVEGASCTLTLRSREEDGDEETASAAIEDVGPVPTFLPPLSVRRSSPDRIQPGWTLVNLADKSGNGNVFVAMVDESARYRWYHRRAGLIVGAFGFSVVPIEGGILTAGHNHQPPAAMIDWDGTVLWEAPFSMHHDILPSPFHDNHLLYLGQTREGCPDETLEGTVNEFDLETGTTIWTWNICERYTPPRTFTDWSHLNAIEPVQGERSALISSREQDTIFKIDWDTGEIIWRLGPTGDFEMIEDDWFYRQHAPELQPDGSIVLYDNGFRTERAWSRAIELELTFDEDDQPLGAAIVWEYALESVYTPARGDADRLDNGNTLITFGGIEPTFHSIVVEVAPSGEEVWELITPDNWAIYRSDRVVEPFLGEVR